jgi:hypothetical protein
MAYFSNFFEFYSKEKKIANLFVITHLHDPPFPVKEKKTNVGQFSFFSKQKNKWVRLGFLDP